MGAVCCVDEKMNIISTGIFNQKPKFTLPRIQTIENTGFESK